MADTEIKLSAAQAKIVEELNKLSALELSQIVKHLENEWGVSAAAPVAAAAPAGAALNQQCVIIDRPAAEAVFRRQHRGGGFGTVGDAAADPGIIRIRAG